MDHKRAALERELRRARDERRWVDADAIQEEIDENELAGDALVDVTRIAG
jgi:hypothetical protein